MVRGTKKQAERALTEALSRRYLGIDVIPEQVTVASYLMRWLSDYAETNVAASTAQRYRVAIAHHISPHIGATRLQALRPIHIQGTHSQCLDEGLAASTITQHHRILRKAFSTRSNGT